MAWTRLFPTDDKAFGYYAVLKKSSNDQYVVFDYKNATPINIPNLKNVHISFLAQLVGIDETLFIFKSTNHTISIKKSSSIYGVYIDDKLQGSFDVTRSVYRRYGINIVLESGKEKFSFIDNGAESISIDLSSMSGDTISEMDIYDPWRNSDQAFNLFNLKDMIISDNKIPLSAAVSVVDIASPVTDWTKNSDGSYQADSVGKSMTIDVPDSAAGDGKVIVYKAAYLTNATGGGDVAGVDISVDGVTETANFTDVAKSYISKCGDKFTMTSKG